MLVREIITDARTGATTERMVEMPDVITGQEAIDAATAYHAPFANESALRGQAAAALADLRAYRDLASPTNAQTVAAVKLLCRVCIGIIRLILRKLESTQ